MAAIQKIEYTTTYDWDTDTKDGQAAASWTKVTDFLSDGLEVGSEESVNVEMGDGAQDQDGVRVNGAFRGTGSNIPSAGTRTWFNITQKDGTRTVVGGQLGCRVRVSQVGTRVLGSGPAHKLVEYSATGSSAGSTVKIITPS